MKTYNKKNSLALYIILMLAAVYSALVISSNWDRGLPIFTRFVKLSEISFAPSCIHFKVIFKENTDVFFISLIIFSFISGIIILLDMSKHELMQGAEYGAASFGSIEKINRKFASKNEHENRVYSEKIRVSLDTYKTKINNNSIVVGGSGTGKSKYLLTPNIYQADAASKYPGSYVITDPDGSLLRETGSFFVNKGYKVNNVNIIPGLMKSGDRINTMKYIRSETDAFKQAAAWIANTKKQGEQSKDPFFDNQAEQLLASLILLVYMEHERLKLENTFCSVLDLINLADVNPDGESELDIIFEKLSFQLESEGIRPYRHAAYRTYKKATKGAEETVLSVISTLNSRMAAFDNEEVRYILSGDDIDITGIGTGITDGRKNVKTALFLTIPDADTTFNAIAGVIYTMIIQELYYQADRIYKGKLPVPVTFWFDEFANIALPDNFPKVIATTRKRDMSVVIIIQNIAQLQDIYKGKLWESIIGNCDTFVYLGGNEWSSFEYISKHLGKRTIWKRSSGVSRGRNGSTSSNEDVMGRELMMPTEVRELDNDYCIVMIRSQKILIDKKFDTFNCPDYVLSKSLPEYSHEHEKCRRKNISIMPINNDTPGILIDLHDDVSGRHPDLEELSKIVTASDEADMMDVKININGMDLITLLSREDFSLTDEELIEVTAGINDGLTDEEIKSYILCGSAAAMKQKRLLILAIKTRKQRENSGG